MPSSLTTIHGCLLRHLAAANARHDATAPRRELGVPSTLHPECDEQDSRRTVAVCNIVDEAVDESTPAANDSVFWPFTNLIFFAFGGMILTIAPATIVERFFNWPLGNRTKSFHAATFVPFSIRSNVEQFIVIYMFLRLAVIALLSWLLQRSNSKDSILLNEAMSYT